MVIVDWACGVPKWWSGGGDNNWPFTERHMSGLAVNSRSFCGVRGQGSIELLIESMYETGWWYDVIISQWFSYVRIGDSGGLYTIRNYFCWGYNFNSNVPVGHRVCRACGRGGVVGVSWSHQDCLFDGIEVRKVLQAMEAYWGASRKFIGCFWVFIPPWSFYSLVSPFLCHMK